MDKLVYSVPEAARALGISRSKAYELVKGGAIPCVKLGKRRVVPKVALEKFLAVTASEAL